MYFPEGTEATSGWISPCRLFKHSMMLYKLKTEGKFLSTTEEMSLRGKKRQITPVPFHWCLKGEVLIMLTWWIKLISKRNDIPIIWPLLCSIKWTVYGILVWACLQKVGWGIFFFAYLVLLFPSFSWFRCPFSTFSLGPDV